MDGKGHVDIAGLWPVNIENKSRSVSCWMLVSCPMANQMGQASQTGTLPMIRRAGGLIFLPPHVNRSLNNGV
jgi:hypothetical protein